jgi:hypothetical protein
MKRVWYTSARVLAGFLITAMYAMPQTYTISARSGVVNYIEGNAFLDGKPISEKALKSTFMNANDTLSTDIGKAEVLLTPGVFLRVGDNSRLQMISPSLTDTQVELKSGEAMLEVDELVKDNHIQVLDHGSSVVVEKTGLYRFTADNEPTVAAIEGKAEVRFGDRKLELGKGHETALSESLKAEKFDRKKEDDLYAWSNVRSEYEAAASYQSAKNVAINDYGVWGGYGFSGWYGPGWCWNGGFGAWAWLPGNGAFFSPFGWGFYAPGLVGYAPIIAAPIYRGGYWNHGHWTGPGKTGAVPVNPNKPGAAGMAVNSPAANQAARTQAARAYAATGFNTATGVHVPAGRASGFSSGSGAGHAYASAGGFHSGGIGAGGHVGGHGK